MSARYLERSIRAPVDAFYICAIENFRVPQAVRAQPGYSAILSDMVLFKPGEVRSLISPNSSDLGQMFAFQVGNSELEFLNRSYGIAASIRLSPPTNPMEHLYHINNYIFNFITYLWQFRDNCCNQDQGVLFERNANQYGMHRNFMQNKLTSSAGRTDVVTEFSHAELKRTFAIVDQLVMRVEPDDEARIHGYPGRPITNFTRDTLRFHRFFLWLRQARTQFDALAKLANYVIAIEALVATSSAELSHQLSERVAVLCPDPKPLSRLGLYKKMKRCYSLRSRALHGDVVKDKEIEELEELNRFLDDLCRSFWRTANENAEFANIFRDDRQIDDCVALRIFGAGEEFMDRSPNVE